MAYVSSSAVEIAYPATKRGYENGEEQYPISKDISEFSLTNIIRLLSPDVGDSNIKGTFIVTSPTVPIDDATSDDDSFIEFCLYGYYFKVKTSAIKATVDSGDIYVGINVSNIDSEYYGQFEELTGIGTEDGNLDDELLRFIGLEFVSSVSEFTSGVNKYFKLIVDTGSGRYPNSDYYIHSLHGHYVISDAEPESVNNSKFWVCTTNEDKPILKYYDASKSEWIALGAVYK